MAGTRVLKRENMKDGDWILVHREPGGLGVPHIIDGRKLFGITVRDFLSDIPTDPVSDTDCPNSGVENILLRPVGFEAGQPLAAVEDRIVVSTDMIVGAYTVANASAGGGIALNVTVTTVVNNGIDTMGTIEIVGTDIDDQELLETITPVTDNTVQGTQAFKTVVSVTGVGWGLTGNADAITVGFGELIGLPDYMPHDRILFAMFNNVREGTHPTAVTSSETVLATNTVDLSSGLNGSVVVIYYLV